MNILVCGSHFDDAEVSCAGMMQNAVQGGDKVYIYVAATKVFISPSISAKDCTTRAEEQQAAINYLGGYGWFEGGFVDRHLGNDNISDDHYLTLVDSIEAAILDSKADVIFIPYGNTSTGGDTHQDHVALSQACLAATRAHKNVFYYEAVSSIDFNPTVFVEIDIEKKIELIKCHKSQMGQKWEGSDLELEDVVRGMAAHRGSQARAGKSMGAEGLLPIRVRFGSLI